MLKSKTQIEKEIEELFKSESNTEEINTSYLILEALLQQTNDFIKLIDFRIDELKHWFDDSVIASVNTERIDARIDELQEIKSKLIGSEVKND